MNLQRAGAGAASTEIQLPLGTILFTPRLRQDLEVDDSLLSSLLVEKQEEVAGSEGVSKSVEPPQRTWPSNLAASQKELIRLLSVMTASVDDAVSSICRSTELKEAYAASVALDETFRLGFRFNP